MCRIRAALRRRLALIVLAALGLAAAGAPAQGAFPAQPITLVVPFAAGGAADGVARVVAEALRAELGQRVVVDNRAGAGGMVGTEAVSRAAADGYTIGLATVDTLALNPVFFDQALRTNRGLQPLGLLATMPTVLTVNPAFAAQDFAGFIAELKRQPPGTYRAAVPGIGSIGHLMIEAYNEAWGVKMTPVPYADMAAAQADAIAGSIQVLSDQAPSVIGAVKAGKLRPLAVSGDRPLPELPKVQTMKKLGFPELNQIGISWFGLVLPAKTPPAVVDTLHAAAQRALKSAPVVDGLAALGAQASRMPVDQWQKLIDESLALNRLIVQRNKISVP